VDATRAATVDATRDAKRSGKKHADDDSKWFSGFDVRAMVELNAELGLGELGLSCAENAFNMYQGGNQWSEICAFYTFFRDVAKLDIDWSKYEPWNVLCMHSGPRIVHPEFCMISDRPEVWKVNDVNEPHCEDGPFCRWRDGSELYSIKGVRVPKWIVSRPADISIAAIDKEENTEVRRIMIERMGHAKYLADTGAVEVHSDEIPIGGGVEGVILRALVKDKHRAQFLCGHDGSTERIYFMSVDPRAKTCSEAHESICGFKEEMIIANA